MRIHEITEGVVHRGREGFVVYSNPSKAQFQALLRRLKEPDEGARGNIDAGTLYVWDAYFAEHHDIARQLGMPDGYVNIIMFADRVVLNYAENDRGSHREAALVARIKECRPVQALYGPDVSVEIEYW